MLAIKFKRIGKKHQPSYRIIIDEKKHRVKSSSTDDVGWFNPILDKYEVNKERVLYWIKNGAKPTPSVHNLLINAGVISGKKIAVHKKPKKAEAAAATPVAPAQPAA